MQQHPTRTGPYWSESSEKKEVTGILLWDLSSAFDTLEHKILCQKLELYIDNKYM